MLVPADAHALPPAPTTPVDLSITPDGTARQAAGDLLFPNATVFIRHATLALAITLDLYIHVLPDIYKEATAVMERLLSGE